MYLKVSKDMCYLQKDISLITKKRKGDVYELIKLTYLEQNRWNFCILMNTNIVNHIYILILLYPTKKPSKNNNSKITILFGRINIIDYRKSLLVQYVVLLHKRINKKNKTHKAHIHIDR